MSAIEFSNERSSENEMDWIIKTNAILSSKLSHLKEDATTTRNTPSDDQNNTRRTERER